MILYLTNSLRINKEEDLTLYTRFKHCIRNIANSAIEGNHIIRGDYEMLADCCKMFEGDDEFYLYFRSLVNNYATMTIPPDISYYIEVVKENPEERDEDGCIISQRQVDDFYMSDSLLCSQLVCEDENDCKFYRFVAEWYIKKENLNYNLKLSEEGGGGGRTIDKVKKHLAANRICLCIVDTDRKYPEMAINDKSKECERLDRQKCGYRCLVINVHEIENLLPLNYIDDLVANDYRYHWEWCQIFKKHFDYLSQSDEREDILPYFDYKKGIKKSDEFLSSNDYQLFGELCWSQNPEINNGMSYRDYVNSLPMNKGIIYNRLSESISRDTLEYINNERRNGSLAAPVLLPFQEREWMRIGKEIVNWSCARIPEGLS